MLLLVSCCYDASERKILAGVEATTKSVERTAEAITDASAAAEQREIHKAVQLDLLPHRRQADSDSLRVKWDGTGVPVVKKETEGRKGQNQPTGWYARSEAGMRVQPREKVTPCG